MAYALQRSVDPDRFDPRDAEPIGPQGEGEATTIYVQEEQGSLAFRIASNSHTRPGEALRLERFPVELTGERASSRVKRVREAAAWFAHRGYAVIPTGNRSRRMGFCPESWQSRRRPSAGPRRRAPGRSRG